jgi:protein gp37
LHGCSYCYARRFAERGLGEYGKHPKGERFLPRFHPERIWEPKKVRKPSRIFVCSMSDIFSPGVHWEWLERVLDARSYALHHTYIWLTKAPIHYVGWAWEPNDWIGATVTCEDKEDLPAALRNLERVQAGVRFISFEPLLGIPRLKDNAAKVLDWIIIGAQTGPSAIQPKPEWVQSIIDFADSHGIPVFLKDSLNRPAKRQEFPSPGGGPIGK